MMQGQAVIDLEFAERMRALLLVPVYDLIVARGYAASWSIAPREMQHRGDVLFRLASHRIIGVEEKIVRWKGKQYTAVTLETWSCTTPGRERRGWMMTGEYDWLLYVWVNEDQQSAYGMLFDFPELKKWFLPLEGAFPFTRTDQINGTECRVVDVGAIPREAYWVGKALPLRQPHRTVGRIAFVLRKFIAPFEHYCPVCGKFACWGSGDRFFCFEHKPNREVANGNVGPSGPGIERGEASIAGGLPPPDDSDSDRRRQDQARGRDSQQGKRKKETSDFRGSGDLFGGPDF